MEINEFRKFGLEVVLKVLKKTSDEIKKYEEIEDFAGVETLTNDVLTKYEKLYEAFTSDALLNIDKSEMESLELVLLDIMKKNKLDLDYISSEIELRISLEGKSGTTAITNLYKLQLKKLSEKKEQLLQLAEGILDEEARLESALRDAIQEDEQVSIIEKMPRVRARYSVIARELEEVHSKLVEIEDILSKKWPCDIYGTISEEKLISIFKETVN